MSFFPAVSCDEGGGSLAIGVDRRRAGDAVPCEHLLAPVRDRRDAGRRGDPSPRLRHSRLARSSSFHLPFRERGSSFRSLPSLPPANAPYGQTIGRFLLSLLPDGKTPSPLAPTPEVLLQAIDSFIDLYSDEDAPSDVPVFRSKGFLERLEGAVPGVRAAVSPSWACRKRMKLIKRYRRRGSTRRSSQS